MEEKILVFDERCINKNAFHRNKRPISIGIADISRIVLSRKALYDKKGSFKYFVGYISETNAFPIPLYIIVPQINGYFKYFDSNNKHIIFLVNVKEMLKKYNAI